ncbi:hypothetical protein Tco_1383686 [Tanacetum coccineum]
MELIEVQLKGVAIGRSRSAFYERRKCLADANLHVPLNEIKIDKTLHFVKELVEIMDHEIRNLKRSKIPLVKVHWNSKRGPRVILGRAEYPNEVKVSPQLICLSRAVESEVNFGTRFP